MAIQVLSIIVAFYNLDFNQIDIKTAFFYKNINQLLYVKLSKSYYKDLEHMMYRLNKVLFNLKQSPHFWYKYLLSFFFEKL